MNKWPLVIAVSAVVVGLGLFASQAYCHISNDGNIETRVVITTQDGQTTSHSLFPEEEVPLPEDAVRVKVDNPNLNFGDEDVFIRITLPDGREGRIDENGGTFTIPSPDSDTPFRDMRGI